MRIYKLRYPGINLTLSDEDAAWELTGLLSTLENALSEAAVALNLYEARASLPVPEEYATFQTPFVCAQAFLSALDRAGKVLKVIARAPGLPSSCATVHDKFTAAFPDLVGLRDTMQHVEDRVRRLKRGGKPIEIQPVENEWLTSPGGSLVIGALIGNSFQSTMENGSLGKVEVSDATLRTLQGIIQELLDVLPWTGPDHESPRRPQRPPGSPRHSYHSGDHSSPYEGRNP